LLNTLSTEADVHGWNAEKKTTMASELQTVFDVSQKIPWCALLTAVKNYNKNLEKLQDIFFTTETKTKTKCSRPRPRL